MKKVRYDPRLPTLPSGDRMVKKPNEGCTGIPPAGPRQVLSKAQALAVRELVAIETALTAGDWCTVRTASIKLAALADGRAAKK
jgi:hypothetical protein